MPKYLIHANYVGDGFKGLLKEGGSKRRLAAEAAVKSVGGTMESFYYAFGATDAYVIVDVPDNASMAAIALMISSTGLVSIRTDALLTPEELDQAAAKSPTYRAPGT